MNLRLRGIHEPIVPIDFTSEQAFNKREAGIDGRYDKREIHEIIRQIQPELPRSGGPGAITVKTSHELMNQLKAADRQATSSLACLSAVDVACRRIDQMTNNTKQFNRTQSQREYRKQMLDRNAMLKDDYRLSAIKQRRNDKLDVNKGLEIRQSQKQELLEKVELLKDKRLKSREQQKQMYEMASGFKAQAASVSRALRTHDHQIFKDARLKRNANLASELREADINQHNMVSKFITNRQLLKQTEVRTTRAAVRRHVAEERRERQVIADERVAAIKQEQARVAELLRATQIVERQYCTDLAELQKQWDTRILMHAGHVGHQHPAIH